MKENARQPENRSRTFNRQAKASGQAPVNEILRAYRDRAAREEKLQFQPVQLQEEGLNEKKIQAEETDGRRGQAIQLMGKGEGDESGSEQENSGEEEDIRDFLSEFTDEEIPGDIVKAFEKAHGEGKAGTKEITDAQRAYQNWLLEKADSGEIMDTHRSAGFEYEFATYEKPEELAIDSHTNLGKSLPLSNIFHVPFNMETDSDNELELVTPPLLLAGIYGAGRANKDAGHIIYQSYRAAAQRIREEYAEQKITGIDMAGAGFGNGWTFSGEANDLVISTGREKHTDSKDQIYSQMNISLTPYEIARFMDEQSAKYKDQDAETLQGTDLFSNAYFRIWNLLNAASQKLLDDLYKKMVPDPDSEDAGEEIRMFEDVESKVLSANVLISRSFSNILAIPGIILNQEYRDRNLMDSQHSAVKETFGVWVKDTIHNVLSGMVSDDPATQKMITKVIAMESPAILETLNTELLLDENGAFPKPDPMDPKQAELQAEIDKRSSGFALQVEKEAKASIGLILKVLQGIAPSFDYQAEFLKESFEGGKAGYGVRKETFVKIPSGLETKLHLAEIRGDENVDEFLGYGEGIGALNIEWVKEKK